MPLFRRKTKSSESDSKAANPPSAKQLHAPPVSGQLAESLSSRSGKLSEPYQLHHDSGYVSTNTSPTPSEHDESHPYSRRHKPVQPEQLLTALPQIPVSSVSAPGHDSNNPSSSHGKQPSVQLHRPVADSPIDLPPLSTLQGFKVNKRGTVLDEEGELIGELVQGDLLDCVRQKVNSRGEVLDDQANVVGHVRTLPKCRSPASMAVLPPVMPDVPLVQAPSELETEHPRSLSKPHLDIVQDRPDPKGDWSPNMFAYRGDVPHRNGPSRSTSHLSFTGLCPLQGMPRPPMNSRHTFSLSTSRSPYASLDPSPHGSEDGGPAFPRPGGYTYKSDFTQAMISGPPSAASSTFRQHRPLSTMSQSPATFATTATINRPRTYFTHQGKITVQPGEDFPKPAPQAAEPKVVKPHAPVEKRRSLFGLGKKK